MPTTITSEERQNWISKYKIAYGKLDKIAAAIDFLSRIAEADSDQKLELDAVQHCGLSALFSILADQLSDSLYYQMPYPDDFAQMCNSKEASHE